MEEQIEDFQKLNIRVNDIPENQRIDVFIGTLKDNIQHELHFWEPGSLEKAFKWARKIERKIMETRNPTTHDYNYVAFQNLQDLHHNNWKKKEKKGFVTISI